jgi:hypothetical protein
MGFTHSKTEMKKEKKKEEKKKKNNNNNNKKRIEKRNNKKEGRARIKRERESEKTSRECGKMLKLRKYRLRLYSVCARSFVSYDYFLSILPPEHPCINAFISHNIEDIL